MSLELAADIVSAILLVAGSIFLVIGAVGLIRMPDVFTRMHAASVSDTLGAGLLVLGMIVQAGFTLVTVKLLIILAILFFAGPISTHALARGALAVGLEPMLFDRSGRRRRKELGLIGEFIVGQDREPRPAHPAAPVKKTSAKKSTSRKRSTSRKSSTGAGSGRGKGGRSSKR
ncbi:monovalent cation/H(+) antiporter subunit G [Microbaculum marinum]|uniref:Monovalent cation/H(+) antiporter subunit G n=1 Tax=Microbaculum marinum TaxID=1764581 RepID=A0AAW9RSS8_9HYPH